MALERMDLYHLWKKDEWEGAFTKADADKDGAIDREEAKALLVDLLEQKLAAVDKKWKGIKKAVFNGVFKARGF